MRTSLRRRDPLACASVEILKVKTENRDGFVHVLLRGELDLSSVAKVQEELRRVEASLLRCSYLTFNVLEEPRKRSRSACSAVELQLSATSLRKHRIGSACLTGLAAAS